MRRLIVPIFKMFLELEKSSYCFMFRAHTHENIEVVELFSDESTLQKITVFMNLISCFKLFNVRDNNQKDIDV